VASCKIYERRAFEIEPDVFQRVLPDEPGHELRDRSGVRRAIFGNDAVTSEVTDESGGTRDRAAGVVDEAAVRGCRAVRVVPAAFPELRTRRGHRRGATGLQAQQADSSSDNIAHRRLYAGIVPDAGVRASTRRAELNRRPRVPFGHGFSLPLAHPRCDAGTGSVRELAHG
jgi:hypothetical protein